MPDNQPFAHRNLGARRAEAGDVPLEWYERHGSWIVFDRELGLEILRDRSFDAADYESDMLGLGAQLGVDVTDATALLHVIPFNKEGSEHAGLRRSMAVAIKERSAQALDVFSRILTERSARILGSPGEADLFEDLLRPAVSAMMAEISLVGGCPFDTDLSPSQSFGIKRPFSAPRLRLMEQKAGVVRAQVAAAGGGPEDAALRLVGLDVTLGSLGASLVRDLDANAGLPLSAMAWSEKLPASALPLVERIASRDCILAGRKVSAGQRLQIYTGAFEEHEDPRHFGAGRHLCLGKALATAAWANLVAALSVSDRTLTIERVRYREMDYSFAIPIEIAVKVE